MACRERSHRFPSASRPPRAAAPTDARRYVASGGVTIVGVIGDTKNAGLRSAPSPVMVIPYSIVGQAQRILAVRTVGNPNLLLNPVRAEVRAIDAEQPLGRSITLSEIIGEEVVRPALRWPCSPRSPRSASRSRPRHLQRPVVSCDRANPRTRRPHGPRRTAQPRPSPDAADGRQARARRPHRRHRGELRLQPPSTQPALRRPARRPRGVPGRDAGARVDRTPRVLRSGETRVAGGSDGRAAPGLRSQPRTNVAGNTACP